MPRVVSRTNLTIAQLKEMLHHHKAELASLSRERAKLVRRISQIDQRIATIGGSSGRGAGGRVRNQQSLMDTIESVLRSSGKPMKVGDVAEAVLSSGYRTNSANFRGIVNQTLIKKTKFVSAGRGLYALKK